MQIIYRFTDGTTTTAEVNEEIGAFIMESRRKEANGNRRHRYHNYSLDAITYEGNEYGRNDLYPCEDDTDDRFRTAMAGLTEVQRRRLLLRIKGWTFQKIADAEGIDLKSCRESVHAAERKFLKSFMRDTP